MPARGVFRKIKLSEVKNMALSGDYKRIIGRLKAGEAIDVQEAEYMQKANQDLFAIKKNLVNRSGELVETETFDPYRFSDQELFQILKKNSRLERGQR